MRLRIWKVDSPSRWAFRNRLPVVAERKGLRTSLPSAQNYQPPVSFMSGDLDKAFYDFSEAASMPGGPSLAMQRHDPTWKAWKRLCDAFADRRKPIQLHGREAEIMIDALKRDLRVS